MIVTMPSKPCLRSAKAAASPVPPPPTMTALFTSDGAHDGVQPMVAIGRGSSLYVNQRLAEAHRNLARLAVADGPRAVSRLDGAHRGDHRGRATGKDLAQRPIRATGAPFVCGDLAFLGLVAEVSGQREEGVPRDSRQERSGQSRSEQPGCAPATEHEAQVHPAHL